MTRSLSLDAIRGVAILLILLGHFVAPAVSRNVPYFASLSPMMWVGVDLFFILSGFLLGGILLRNRESPSYFSAFYGRRFLRILPLYAICVAFFFLHSNSAGESLWPYLIFAQNIVWSLDSRWGPAATAPMWSLAVEEQFYLVLPLLIRFCPPRMFPWLIAGLIICAPVFRAIFHLAGLPFAAYYMLFSRLDSLFLGVLVAWALQQKTPPFFVRRRVLFSIVAAAGISLIALLLANLEPLDWTMSVVGVSVIAVFFAALLAIIAQMPPSNRSLFTRVLGLFGLGAYSIYLFHMPLLTIAQQRFGPSVVLLASCLVAICAIAWVCWIYIERPAIALGHRVFSYAGRREAVVSGGVSSGN